MVVTQVQFNKAMEEINQAFQELQKKVEALEAKPATKSQKTTKSS